MLGFVVVEAEEEQAVRAGNCSNSEHNGIIGDRPAKNKRKASVDSNKGANRYARNWA